MRAALSAALCLREHVRAGGDGCCCFLLHGTVLVDEGPFPHPRRPHRAARTRIALQMPALASHCREEYYYRFAKKRRNEAAGSGWESTRWSRASQEALRRSLTAWTPRSPPRAGSSSLPAENIIYYRFAKKSKERRRAGCSGQCGRAAGPGGPAARKGHSAALKAAPRGRGPCSTPPRAVCSSSHLRSNINILVRRERPAAGRPQPACSTCNIFYLADRPGSKGRGTRPGPPKRPEPL